jgi:hypothetical protein
MPGVDQIQTSAMHTATEFFSSFLLQYLGRVFFSVYTRHNINLLCRIKCLQCELGLYSSVIEHLPSMSKTLGSIPSTETKWNITTSIITRYCHGAGYLVFNLTMSLFKFFKSILSAVDICLQWILTFRSVLAKSIISSAL